MKGIKDKIRQRWYLRWLLLFSNWLSQGIINADKTEKIYKLFLTICFTFIFYFLFLKGKGLFITDITLSFICGHSLNWFVNGSISTILIHRLFISSISKQKAFNYLVDLKSRLNSNNYILVCAVFGSIARGSIKPSSDIDITFVRAPGFYNAIKAIVFMVKEKFKTNSKLIPIEPFLADSAKYMKKRYCSDEMPVVIKDNSATLSDLYSQQQTLQEAAERNNFQLK